VQDRVTGSRGDDLLGNLNGKSAKSLVVARDRSTRFRYFFFLSFPHLSSTTKRSPMAWIASDVVNEPGRTVTSSVSSEQGSPANPIRYAQSEVKMSGWMASIAARSMPRRVLSLSSQSKAVRTRLSSSLSIKPRIRRGGGPTVGVRLNTGAY